MQMVAAPWQQLTEEEVRQFIEQGYVAVRGAFSHELAARILPLVWAELEIDIQDLSTWTQPSILLQKILTAPPIPEIHTPRYSAVIDDLCGRGRWYDSGGVGYWPIVLPGFFSPPWKPPRGGWHLDGRLEVSHIATLDRALVGLELFTDIRPGGGGTVIRVGSHHVVAHLLAEAEPEGLRQRELQRRSAAATTHLPVIEITGQAGDVILMHPLTVHASSPNTGNRVRVLANKPVWFREPMNLDRQNGADYSPVERAIVAAIGKIHG
jgi:hypothetical protein